MKLDRIDFEILKGLQDNARISNKELAEINGISPSTCHERLRRLNEAEVITRYTAEVDPSVLGIGVQAMISLRMGQHTDASSASLFKDLSQRDEVVNVYLVAGSKDYLVHVAAKDVQHLREIVVDSYSARPEISNVETSLIFDFYHRTRLPNYSAPGEEIAELISGQHI